MGVQIDAGATNTRVGTDGNGVADAAERNVVSGNNQHGVAVNGAGTNGTIVAGNYLGTNYLGTAAVPNGWCGIAITGGAKFTRVGTDANGTADVAERNIISGNALVGVWITDAGTEQNVVAGNWIGIDATGLAALANGWEGVAIGGGAKNNRLGSGNGTSSAAERNVISGNALSGVSIGRVFSGTGTTGNIIAGNYIGTDYTGSSPLPNLGDGILIVNGATGNHIGYTFTPDLVVADFNTRDIKRISGTTGAGTVIVPAGTGGLTRPNTLLIGPDGNIYVNSEDGSGAGDDILRFGPTGQFLGNFIPNTGVYEAHFAFGPDGNVYIVDPYRNQVSRYDGTTGSLLGSFAVAPGSRAMAFGPDGYLYTAERFYNDGGDFYVYDPLTGASLGQFNDPSVDLNRPYDPVWGPDGDFFVPVANDDKVLRLDGETGTLVSVIDTSGHERHPLFVRFAPNGELYVGSYGTGNSGGGSIARYNPDTGAFLGYADGPNGGIVSIPFGFDFIGGGTVGNTIAFNTGAGVSIRDGGTTGNTMEGNSIHSNTGIGIDLGGDGVTPNDVDDADSGPNNLVNFPVLTSATNGAATRVTGTFNSEALAPSHWSSSPRRRRTPRATAKANDSWALRRLSRPATFEFSIAASSTGEWITATITDAAGNTSEFSLAFLTNNPPVADAGGPYVINEGDNLNLDASATTDLDEDDLLYSWDVNGDGVFGDVEGVNPTLTWYDLIALGIDDGPRTGQISVRVDDQRGGVVTSDPIEFTLK